MYVKHLPMRIPRATSWETEPLRFAMRPQWQESVSVGAERRSLSPSLIQLVIPFRTTIKCQQNLSIAEQIFKKIS